MDQIKVIDVRVLPGDSAFLLDAGDTTILYDSGFGFTGFKVAENIKKYLGERPLDYIFLTHSHYDHALGSAYILRSYPDTKVVAGEYAANVFKREGALKTMQELDSKCAAENGVTDYPFLSSELRVDIPVKDGDIIKAGSLTFEAVDLPGHTKCSVGFYCKEKELLLSTETLGIYAGNGEIFPCYLVGYQMSLDSMEKISAYKITYILTPHIGLLNKEESAYFLKNMRSANEEFANIIVQLLQEGKDAKAVIDAFEHKYWHDKCKAMYPRSAMELNVRIMTDLIKKEMRI